MDLQPTLLQEPGEDKSTVQAVLRLIPCSVSLTLHIFLSRSLSFPLCLYLLSDSFSVGLFLSLNLCLRMTPCISISAFCWLYPFTTLFLLSLFVYLSVFINFSFYISFTPSNILSYICYFLLGLPRKLCLYTVLFIYFFFNHYSMNWILGLALGKVTNITFILFSVQGYSHCPSIEKTKIKKTL